MRRFRALAVVLQAACLSLTAQAQDSKAPDPTFDVLEYEVEGNTVLPTIDVERAVYPFLGEKKHFADVEAARKALEDAYQKRGYQTVFVDIPEQKVVSGVIHLHVLEGKVERTRVTGSRYFLLGEIRTRAEQLSPGEVPDFGQVQRELAELNKTPDRQVSPILKPGRTPGSVDVELSVKDQLPLHGDAEVDNYSSPFTAQDRASASIHYDNLWQRQHSLAISYQAAPSAPAESSVWSGTYLWRFAGADDVLTAYAIHSRSNVAVVGSTTVLGNATIYGARWIKPIGGGFVQGANFFNTLTFGIDRKDFGQTNINAQTGAFEPLPAIDYSPISLTYGATLVRDSGLLQFSFGPSSAPRSLFGNSDIEFRGRRVLGGASWVDWKGDFSAEHWFGRHLSAYARFTGQWTSDPLIPNEQFITGGGDSVRGYREAEISGDRGVQGTLELREYPLGRPAPDGRRSLYVELFTDGADVRMVDPQGPQIPGIGIASAGFGVHGQGWHGFHVDADLARTLRNGGSGVNGYVTPTGVWRIDFKVGDSF